MSRKVLAQARLHIDGTDKGVEIVANEFASGIRSI